MSGYLLERPTEEIRFCIANIKEMAGKFEGKRMPDWAIGAIEGWCNRLERLAKSLDEQS